MTEDGTTEPLLQLAGRRKEVPAARMARVRTHVHEAWRADRRRRKWQRLIVAAAAASAVATVLVAVLITPRPSAAPSLVVATVDRAEGTREPPPGSLVRSGEWIETGRGARVALRTPAGTSLRLDEHSRARLLSDRSIELTAGAVYLDTAERAPAVDIRTPFGVITDIGTQFEVRLVADALRVRVRSGIVSVKRERASIQVEANTEVTLSSRGAESRAAPGFGDSWQWTTSLAPVFHIDGQKLNAFLEYVARENGWTVYYEDAALQRTAASVVLHGSVEGLDAEAALGVALTIADLSHTLERGELRIWRSSSP